MGRHVTSLQSTGVRLADTEQMLRRSEPSGTQLPGREIFYEHVHLNFEGNYLVARAILPALEKALPQWVREKAAVGKPVPSVAECGQELMFTSANAYLNLVQMRTTITPYPFTAQLGHEARLASFDQDLGRLQALATPEVQRATLAGYRLAYQRHPEDLLLAFNYAKILSLTGDIAGSNDIIQQIAATQPHLPPSR